MLTIVTDTSVGYSRAELVSRGIRQINLSYTISGIAYQEHCRGENGAFLEAMRGRLVKTSQPSPYAFCSLFEELTRNGGEALCVTLDSCLSGTYSSACKAAKDCGGIARVVDSKTISGGMHMFVDEAVNMAVGGMDIDTICENLEQLRGKIHTIFTVDTLDGLHKGGRLAQNHSPNTTLNSRPILLASSGIKFVTNARGVKQRIETLLNAIPNDARRIFVMKSGEKTDTTMLELALSERFPNIKIHRRMVGPIITIHLGEGAFGVAYMTK